MSYISLLSGIFILFIFHSVSGAVLDQYFGDSSPCDIYCDEVYPDSADFKKACAEGCRLFKIIGLAKGYNANKTLTVCISACSEAFMNETSANACNQGCHHHVSPKSKDESDTQTLHLLTPLFYVRSAYNSMAHHVRQFISTSWTVYVQEDSGKMIVLQTNPKIIESTEYPLLKEKSSFSKNYQSTWQEDRLDWMDCISHQSGIPRWLLVIVLFGFILALLWLCCATAASAPNHYLSSNKKKNFVNEYVLLWEPNHGSKPLITPPPLVNCDEEAPPLPPKVSLI